MERILAIDYGRRRTGLAASDPLGITALPVKTLEGTAKQALDAIAHECAEREIGRLVIGLPLNMDGTEGEMAEEVRRFAALLAERTGLPVSFIDERLTSHSAEQELRKVRKGKRGKRDRGRVDAMAAAQILRDYLDLNG